MEIMDTHEIIIAAQVKHFPTVYQAIFSSDDPTIDLAELNGMYTMPHARDICRKIGAKALFYDGSGAYKGYVHSDGSFFLS